MASQGLASGSLPARKVIEASRGEFLHRGAWSKADIYLAQANGETFVVKDFAAKSWPIRWLGRLQGRREGHAYELLSGISGVARYLGRIDAHALALERVEGTPLRKFRKRTGRKELLETLRGVLDLIHGQGVIHNDLRRRRHTLAR